MPRQSPKFTALDGKHCIVPFPPHFVGLPHLIHQVREEQGELASSPRKEVNVDLNIMLNFPPHFVPQAISQEN